MIKVITWTDSRILDIDERILFINCQEQQGLSKGSSLSTETTTGLKSLYYLVIIHVARTCNPWDNKRQTYESGMCLKDRQNQNFNRLRSSLSILKKGFLFVKCINSYWIVWWRMSLWVEKRLLVTVRTGDSGICNQSRTKRYRYLWTFSALRYKFTVLVR